MSKRPFLLALAVCAALAPFSAPAAGVNELRIGFVPGPYADEFKAGVEPQLRHFQQAILNNHFYDGFCLPEYFASK
jgi:D-methionine transport system substrate-binding protein